MNIVSSHMNINQPKSPQLDKLNLSILSILIIGQNKLEENTFLFFFFKLKYIVGKLYIHIKTLCIWKILSKLLYEAISITYLNI